MTGKIIIEDLEVQYRVGVPDEERAKPQRLLLTIEMERAFDNAAAADDLAQTIDYLTVSRRMLAFGEGREWRLIETLAVEVAKVMRREYGAAGVRVMVKKFVIPESRWVAVEVVLGQR